MLLFSEESDHPEPESDQNPELDFDVETAQFEDLTEEQIAMVSCCYCCLLLFFLLLLLFSLD